MPARAAPHARDRAGPSAVLGSAPILLGLNRANIDLVLFLILGPCVPALMSSRRLVRLLAAPALIALAAGLKYYLRWLALSCWRCRRGGSARSAFACTPDCSCLSS